MKPTVYLETSVISYLTSEPSRDIIIAGHQQITHDWWNNHRQRFDLYVSEVVLKEIRLGNREMAKKRLDIVRDLPDLGLPEGIETLAESLITEGPLPSKAIDDALHISLAAVHEIDFILSWNCKHIANLFIQKDLAKILAKRGFRLPIIGTPESLMGDLS